MKAVVKKIQNRYQAAASSLFALALSFVLGCGTWIANPDAGPTPKPDDEVTQKQTESDVAISVKPKTTSNKPAGSADAPIPYVDKSGKPGGSVTFEKAFMVIKEVRFVKDINDPKKDVKMPGPFLINLLTNEITPQMTKKIPVGVYADTYMVLEKIKKRDLDTLSGDPELKDRSTYVKGQYKSVDGVIKTFQLKFDTEPTVSLNKVNDANGMEVKAGEALQLDINFKVENWFNFQNSEHDFASITETDIQLNKTSTAVLKSLFETIMNNFLAATSLTDPQAVTSPPASLKK